MINRQHPVDRLAGLTVTAFCSLLGICGVIGLLWAIGWVLLGFYDWLVTCLG